MHDIFLAKFAGDNLMQHYTQHYTYAAQNNLSDDVGMNLKMPNTLDSCNAADN